MDERDYKAMNKDTQGNGDLPFFIMEKVLELISKKKDEYRRFKGEMRHDMNVAKKLGFDVQVTKINTDHTWANEILELLEEIAIEVQSSNELNRSNTNFKTP